MENEPRASSDAGSGAAGIPGDLDSQAARARVGRYYELVDAADVSGLIGLFAADAVYQRPGYEPIVGHEGLSRFYRQERLIAHGRHVLTEMVAHGDSVAVQGRFHGVLRSGAEVDLRFADFFRLTRDLTFSRRDTYFFQPLV